jgi:hypothetical protein
MSFAFDFGFEGLGAHWDDAGVAFLFAAAGEEEDFGKSPGALAVADASRYAEFFEMRGEILPMDIGVYAEICNGPDPLAHAVSRALSAVEKGILPVVICDDRRVTKELGGIPLIALWGKIGRAEIDEPALLRERTTVIAGVRAATSNSLKAIPSNAAVVTAGTLSAGREPFNAAVHRIKGPAHLSIDLDVLSPSVSQTPRSIEPGGVSWYDLVDAIEMVFAGQGVASADLVGTKNVQPRSPAALLSAQILLKIAGLATARSKK